MLTQIVLSRRAEEDLSAIPLNIKSKLQGWIESVMHEGLEETRKHLGYHDEPLKGVRYGQRSIRLNRTYRAIYLIKKLNFTRIIEILEITKHAY